jgi:alpha-L-fucosidase
MERLQGIGKWMRVNSPSIYGCGPAPEDIDPPPGCAYTYNAKTNRLYLHILSWPYGSVFLPGLAGRVEYARLLNDHSEIRVGLDGWHASQLGGAAADCAALTLPHMPPPEVEIPVIEIFLKN